MNTLVIYESVHGCTQKCAKHISKNITGNVKTINLREKFEVDLSNFSNIIIGGSIHTGHINPSIKLYCEKNIKSLLNKNIGIFLCFMDPQNKFNYYLNKSFPEKLINKAKAKAYFGGELDFSKLTFFEKLYIKRTTNLKCSTSKINVNTINQFCDKMNKFIAAN